MLSQSQQAPRTLVPGCARGQSPRQELEAWKFQTVCAPCLLAVCEIVPSFSFLTLKWGLGVAVVCPKALGGFACVWMPVCKTVGLGTISALWIALPASLLLFCLLERKVSAAAAFGSLNGAGMSAAHLREVAIHIEEHSDALV